MCVHRNSHSFSVFNGVCQGGVLLGSLSSPGVGIVSITRLTQVKKER